MISFIIYFTECLHVVRVLKRLILPWGALFLSHFPKYWYNFANKKLLVTSGPLVVTMMPQTWGTFWKITTRHIRRFKCFQKAVVMMFWYLEHWWILYLKQRHKLRCYVIALMTFVNRPWVRYFVTRSKLAQFTGMKSLAIIAVTWDNRGNTFKRKNFGKTFRDLSFLWIGCISTWCLRKKQFWKK